MTELPVPDHAALVDVLKSPSFYPHPVEAVKYQQTHISSLFLTGDKVYKLKKPMDFGFLDFTTAELRKQFCEAEVRLNSRLAPSVYERVAALTLDDGEVVLDGSGPAVDWLVVMRQLDEQRLGQRVLESGELGPGHIDQVVEILVRFFREAATGGRVDDYGTPEAFKVNTDENFAQTEGFVPQALSRQRFDEIRAYTDSFYANNRELFQRRIDGGWVRECHGDLHLGNIFFVEPPVIFDCIEFNERFRCSDVAADLGFLAMDLDFRGRPELAERLISRYVELSGDHELPKVIDFYRCYRAYVRGKIACFTASDPSLDETMRQEQLGLARRYFALAHRYAGSSAEPVLAVVFGLMGTGKTSLGRYLEDSLGWQVLNSDVIRKQLAGLDDTTRVYVPYGEGLYSAEMTSKTFDELFNQARQRLEAGTSVVLDGSFKSRQMRARAVEAARECDAQVVLIQTTCEPDEQHRRLSKREANDPDVSDGRVELIEAQRRDFELPGATGNGAVIVLATDGPKEQTRAALRDELERRGLVPGRD